MKSKTLKAFFALGLLLLISGAVLILNFNKIYGVGIMCLGAMLAIISFGQIRALKQSKT